MVWLWIVLVGYYCDVRQATAMIVANQKARSRPSFMVMVIEFGVCFHSFLCVSVLSQIEIDTAVLKLRWLLNVEIYIF